MAAGQHVGRQSDSLQGEDADGRHAIHERLKRVSKPTGRVFHGISDIGDGSRCPVEGHGKKYRLKGGGEWCPNQSHDTERMKTNGA